MTLFRTIKARLLATLALFAVTMVAFTILTAYVFTNFGGKARTFLTEDLPDLEVAYQLENIVSDLAATGALMVKAPSMEVLHATYEASKKSFRELRGRTSILSASVGSGDLLLLNRESQEVQSNLDLILGLKSRLVDLQSSYEGLFQSTLEHFSLLEPADFTRFRRQLHRLSVLDREEDISAFRVRLRDSLANLAVRSGVSDPEWKRLGFLAVDRLALHRADQIRLRWLMLSADRRLQKSMEGLTDITKRHGESVIEFTSDQINSVLRLIKIGLLVVLCASVVMVVVSVLVGWLVVVKGIAKRMETLSALLTRKIKDKQRGFASIAGDDEIGDMGRAVADFLAHGRELVLTKSALDQVRDGILLFDPNTRLIFYVNDGEVGLSGYGRNELIGMRPVDLKLLYDDDTICQLLDPLRSGEVAYATFETTHCHRDGHDFPVEITLQYIQPDDFSPFVIAVVRDISERKEMETQLRVREQEFRTLSENSPDTIGRYDLDGRRLYANPALMRMAERQGAVIALAEAPSASGWPGKAEVEGYENALRQAARTGEEVIYEFEWPLPDGQVMLAHFRCVPERDADGSVVSVLAIGRDLSDRLALERELRETGARLDSIVSTLPGVAYQKAYSADGVELVYISDSIRDVYGWDIDAAYDMETAARLSAFWHPDDHDALRGMIGHMAAGSPHAESRARIKMPGGGYRWMLSREVATGTGEGKTIVTGLMLDIDEQVKAEEQSRMLAVALDETSECVALANEDGGYEYVNDSFCRVSGYSRGDLLRKRVTDLVEGMSNKAWREHWRKLRAKKSMLVELANRRRDGSTYSVEANISLVTYRGRQMRLVLAKDISERQRHQAEIEAARDEAETANRAKSQFLSSMSHELRTPLNGIMGFGQLLATDPDRPLTDHQAGAVRQILRSSEHLLELIGQVLDLAKIESGSLSLSMEPVETGPVITDCVSLMTAVAGMRSISVNRNKSEDDKGLTVNADRTRLRQALLNLLSNATKYNKEGGSITVSCERVKSGMIRFSVADTGYGIALDKQKSVFTPFDRLGAEGSTTEGTGIGLSITRQIIECMGGEIGFSSVEGEGTTFWFELPATEGKEEKKNGLWEQDGRKGAPHWENDGLPPCSILYVEDNPVNLKMMEMLLERFEGLTLHNALSAETGIEIAQSVRPDLVLMDINLPGMDGYAALKALRATPTTKAIPVIAASANAMTQDIEKAEEAGFDDYIVKPFNIQDVISTMSRHLKRMAHPYMGE